MIRCMLMLASLAAGPAAMAKDTPLVAGDIALVYGRNWGQQLNVAGLVGEVKINVHDHVSVGARLGGDLGVAIGASDTAAAARGYAGLPLMAKAEVFALPSRIRPFAGLGLGMTRAAGGGVVAAVGAANAQSSSYSVAGVMPTFMPEIGVDLGKFRIALHHAVLVGSSGAVKRALEVGADGVRSENLRAPGLSGTRLQLGLHFGGPK